MKILLEEYFRVKVSSTLLEAAMGCRPSCRLELH
jgi:hypothetical protein